MSNAYEDFVKGVCNRNLCKEESGMREFDTGATRDSDENKIDYEGLLSPWALQRYGEYMNKHRVQTDGKIRDSDNWQKGIPLAVYMKSLWRHLIELWACHRGGAANEYKKDVLCAIIFNASGYLHEIAKPQSTEAPPKTISIDDPEYCGPRASDRKEGK